MHPPANRSQRSAAVARGLAVLSLALAVLVVALWMELRAGRATREPPPEAPPRLVLEPAALSDLVGWGEDPLDGFAGALGRTCDAMAASGRAAATSAGSAFAGTLEDWRAVCALVSSGAAGDDLRAGLERELQPWAMRDGDGGDQALVTGYYEPLLRGSRRPDARYSVPLHVRPPELIDVDLGAFREDLRGRRLAGIVRGERLVPFADRARLEEGALAGRGLELLWVDDPIDAFFLHIQGSGRVELPDSTHLRVGYAAQNGHPYVAIGRELVARGAMPLEDVTMQSIRAWLAAHPAEASAVMRSNPSYVFFRELQGEGPVGSQGVELTPYRSIAVDPAFVPLGLTVWLEGQLPSPRPGEPDRPLRRLVVAQDTGGAIRGPLRADLFCGHGDEAAEVAGRLKHPARAWLLLPRHLQP